MGTVTCAHASCICPVPSRRRATARETAVHRRVLLRVRNSAARGSVVLLLGSELLCRSGAAHSHHHQEQLRTRRCLGAWRRQSHLWNRRADFHPSRPSLGGGSADAPRPRTSGEVEKWKSGRNKFKVRLVALSTYFSTSPLFNFSTL